MTKSTKLSCVTITDLFLKMEIRMRHLKNEKLNINNAFRDPKKIYKIPCRSKFNFNILCVCVCFLCVNFTFALIFLYISGITFLYNNAILLLFYKKY